MLILLVAHCQHSIAFPLLLFLLIPACCCQLLFVVICWCGFCLSLCHLIVCRCCCFLFLKSLGCCECSEWPSSLHVVGRHSAMSGSLVVALVEVHGKWQMCASADARNMSLSHSNTSFPNLHKALCFLCL